MTVKVTGTLLVDWDAVGVADEEVELGVVIGDPVVELLFDGTGEDVEYSPVLDSPDRLGLL